jgi:hypothetical protein
MGEFAAGRDIFVVLAISSLLARDAAKAIRMRAVHCCIVLENRHRFSGRQW